jgi:Family of unknown function (DUF6178)
MPDNVIALSRYRAQLGRGRKLRRAEALLAGPDPERAIRALPGDEFYYVINELGLRDASDILFLARAEQVQAALDFALWERDQILPERLGEWLEAIAEAPYETIGAWVKGLDIELVALLLRKTGRIYDLTQEEAPDEPEGTFYPTPDTFFLLDVTGTPPQRDADADAAPDSAAPDSAAPPPSAGAVIRILDSLYRADQNLARRILVGARAELDAELEELAYRWREGRMEDLGFSDYYEALEVYRELDPATVRIGETEPGKARVRPLGARQDMDAPARAPAALVDSMSRGASPFSRAVQALTSPDEIAELHFALVALTNRVLAADRITPGDDKAVAATLERMLATLDLGVEVLSRGQPAREVEAVRTVPLTRLFRLGVSLIGKVKRLAITLRRKGPFAPTGRDLSETEEAPVLEAVSRHRPAFAGILDDPPSGVDRPFRTLADLARATAVIESAAAAQAMLLGLGITPEVLAPGSPLLEGTGTDDASVDAALLARTALVRALLGPKGSRSAANPPMPLAALDAQDVRDFEALLDATPGGAVKLPEVLKRKAKAILDAVAPKRLGGAAADVAERWIASLAPLEPVLVRRPTPRRPRGRKE